MRCVPIEWVVVAKAKARNEFNIDGRYKHENWFSSSVQVVLI